MAYRKPTDAEIELIGALIERAEGIQLSEGWLDHVLVEEMSDGGMGSLKLLDPRRSALDKLRKFGQTASERRLLDVDGVEVLASLNVDTAGEPFELDMWKVDFTPLIRVPKPLG